MSELENIQIFFNENGEFRKRGLLASFLAKEARINAISLRKFMNHEKGRYLTCEQITKLIPVLIQFGYKPINT